MQRIAAALAVIMLSACLPPPSDELMRSVADVGGQPRALDAAQLEACAAPEIGAGQLGRFAVRSNAYSPALTVKIAQMLEAQGGEMATAALMLRAYAVDLKSTGRVLGMFDPRPLILACYYRLDGGRLTLVATLTADQDGRVDQYDLLAVQRKIGRGLQGKENKVLDTFGM